MTNELLSTGRKFLVLLQKVEDKTRASEISFFPSSILIQIINWKYTLAFIIRKLSVIFDGATDYDHEIKTPLFSLKCKNGEQDA